MKKSFIKALFGMIFAGSLFLASAQANRKPWNESPNPKITSVTVDKDKPSVVIINFELETPRDNSGADKADIIVTGPEKHTLQVGKTRNAAKSVSDEFKTSGEYTVIVYGLRNKESVKHASEPFTFNYVLPLGKPEVSALNIGNGEVQVSWTPVSEATGYILSYTDNDGKTVELPATKSLSTKISGLKDGVYSKIIATAVRGEEKSSSNVFNKLVRADAERIWKFTEFGTSTKADFNRMEMIDPNDLKFTLYSCTYDPKTGNIADKGGKFESFFDGMSFYYTTLDPKKENFELTCTVTVDYHNPMADGQEGFAVLATDTLGVDGEPMVIAYNNSTGIITRKFTTHVNGVKKEIKNGIGYRQVTGITKEIIAEGDAAISQKCKSVYKAFSYDQASDAIKTGDVYRVTLKKDNTGYHSIYKRPIPSEDSVEEYIMYDLNNEKLLQLDKKNIYVGFAVARGCNATFSDIVFNTSDPATDPAGEPEPPELVPLKTLIDCPVTWYNGKYPFVFSANAKGTVHVETTDGKVLIKNDPVEANKDYKKMISINKTGNTDLLVTFDPEDKWVPEQIPGEPLPNKAIAQYNRETLLYEVDYKPVTYSHSITVMTLKGKNLYVSPDGNILNSLMGAITPENTIDLVSAIQFSAPGQTIILAPGKYYPAKSIEIERGNDGTPKARKVLKSADPNNRAVLDFSSSKATVTALNLYGSYWTIENIDITKTPGDCKGLQIAGNYNEIRMVDAYENGDTGIQIAGRSAEGPEKWPHHNLIYGCESFGNSDPAQNNADGFASKLTSGEGNVFRNCVAHHNVDDGWDLYAKIETGPIGAVLLDNCLCYANGTKLDGTGQGDGNGFKLGGDGINVPHILRNSISWNNGVNGVTCNSNPGLILENVTVYGSGSYNVTLYGKGDAKAYPRTFKAKGVLSVSGGAADSFDNSKDPDLKGRLATEDNYFCNGAKTLNSKGDLFDPKTGFVSTDTSKWQKGFNEDGSFNRIPRNASGEFELGDLFKKTDKAPANAGANYNAK